MFAKSLPSRPRSRLCTLFQVFVAALAGAFAAKMGGPQNGSFFFVLVASFIVCVLAVIVRWRWLIPCTILGIMFGAMADLHVKGGSIQSQMQETCWNLGGGTFLGLLIGVCVDFAAIQVAKESKDQM